ncbi:MULTISPECIES: NtaA/DmoA family FMN-dependent monooxygenase [unclassified Streptomyces]|uniref:NtaA/DmoA family FMN-dependent monooxygenase n=1 Tax=unclassified Streptomyces TaxID=2593676 RepID=UPI00380B812A
MAKPTNEPVKQIHLGVLFPAVNSTTVWSDPEAGSQVAFSSFAHIARTAERARFDFLFLGEDLRLREAAGELYDLDVCGRPDNFTVLAALAAVTDRLGLVASVNSTFNEPYEVARQFGSLDHLSAGRAGWNVVTSWSAFTGENFRRGGYLAEADRYQRAKQFLAAARELFGSWPVGEPVADQEAGAFLGLPAPGRFAVRTEQFDISGHFNVPRSPQNGPVIFQAGDSEEGREFAASTAEAVFCRHGTLAAGQAFYADVKRRLGAYGRAPDDLKILPGAAFVLGDTDAEARERAAHIRRQQVSGPTAIKQLEQVWNRDLSDYDPDGPLPGIDPLVGENTRAQGWASIRRNAPDALAIATKWRALAEEKRLSIRELVIQVTARQSFVGTPARVADELVEFVRTDACDGFVLFPHLVPGGIDDFADQVVPLLQERGAFRTEYEGETLREHLNQR